MAINFKEIFNELPKERQERILKRADEIHEEYLKQKKKDEKDA